MPCSPARFRSLPLFLSLFFTGVLATAPGPLAAAEVPSVRARFRPGLGLQVASSDDRFELDTWVRGQLRYSLLSGPLAPSGIDQSIELKRAALFLAGHAFGPHNHFFIQLVFAPRDLAIAADGSLRQSPLFDGFFFFDYLRDFSVRVGQFKPFFSRQFIAGWGDLQLVDRSVVELEFLLDRDLGADFYSDDFLGLKRLRYHAGVFLGRGRNAFQLARPTVVATARLEYLPLGLFDDYVEADLARRRSPKLAIAVAYAYQHRARRDRGVVGNEPSDLGTTDLHDLVADFMFKLRGLSVTGAFFWRDGRRHHDPANVQPPLEAPRDGLGYFVQAGWVLPRIPLELCARGGQTFPLGVSTLPRQGEVGGGLSFYPGAYLSAATGHAFKVQADYFRLWNPAGLLSGGSDVFRVMLQLGL